MHITDIELYGYVPFSFSHIELFKMSTMSSTILINSINGAGKSSLLRECVPLPSTRSDYTQDGYKKISLSHENFEYVLKSDFSNKSKPHSFMKDLVELNESGSTNIQSELIEKHLGYTSEYYEILRGKYNFVEMTPAVRKTLLLTQNPYQLGFILDEYKSISSAIRSCQSNLTRLYERKVELEGEYLDKNLEEQLQLEYKKLSDEILLLVEFVHRCREQISSLESSRTYNKIDLSAIKNYIKLATNSSSKYTNIPRTKLDEYMIELQNRVTENTTTLSMLSEQETSCVNDINRYSQFIGEENKKELIVELQNKIESIKEEAEILKKSLIEQPFDKIHLNDIPDHMNKLSNILNTFIGCGKQLQSPDIIDKFRSRLRNYKDNLSGLNYKLSNHAYKLQELEKHLIVSGPDPECVSTICPLLLQYRKDQNRVKSDYAYENNLYLRVKHKVDRYMIITNGLSDKLKYLESYLPILNEFSSYVSLYSYLRVPIRSLNIIHTLRTNPFNILTKINDYYQRSLDYYKYQDMVKELDLCITKYTKMTSNEDVDRTFIQQIVSEKQDLLCQLRNKISNLSKRINGYKIDLSLSREYQSYTNRLVEYKEELDTYEKQAIVSNDIDILKKIKDSLELHQIASATRLAEISKILRNQETLKVRYEEEVIKQIQILEKQKSDMSHIERALSPNKGILHRYTVQFINKLIITTNYFISRVFSYKLELIPIEIEDVLTYKFPVYVGDIYVPDISTCSAAQSEMINFAFTLALIIQLKLTDYPLHSDEWGKSMDSYHKQKLLELLKSLVDENIISQLFLISHDIIFSGGLVNTDVVILNPNNIILPEVYNENVEIIEYV
jgi:hypothetical protein